MTVEQVIRFRLRGRETMANCEGARYSHRRTALLRPHLDPGPLAHSISSTCPAFARGFQP
jgi:hypothetical protein